MQTHQQENIRTEYLPWMYFPFKKEMWVGLTEL